jgi:hypothetical protein
MNSQTYEYIVLSDDDTFDSVDNCYVYVLTEEGSDDVSDSGGFKHLDEKHIIEKISIADLLDCYFTHETKD